MIKMIIVDDEYIILDSLKTLIDWNSIGVEVTGTADNGAAAIDLTLKQKPDIILSDISMPCFSGLEMLETLRRNDLDAEVIFITAYGKFEYAREAIRHGVFDYILKPVDEDLLLQSVSRCAAKIRAEKQRRRQAEQNACEAERRREEIFLRCLTGGKFPGEAEWAETGEAGAALRREPYCTLIGFLPEDAAGAFPDPGVFPPSWPLVTLRAEERLVLCLVGSPFPLRQDWPSWAAVTQGQAGSPMPEPSGESGDPAGSFRDFTVVVSESAEARSCFERAYAQVSFALIWAERRREKTGSAPGLFFFAELKKLCAGFPGFDRICASLARAVREGGTEKIPELLFRFFLGFLEKEIFYDIDMVELSCIEVAEHVRTAGGEYLYAAETSTAIPEHPGGSIPAFKKSIASGAGLRQVFAATVNALINFRESVIREETRSSRRLVRQSVRYIHEHYGEEITLPALAGRMLISPNYLSKIFSAEMGKPFSRYLQEYRIEEAKKLLRENFDKVYEVAARVGYADVVHFSKIFKQLTGMSPNRFRNRRY
ncbi:MAG: response regulator [Treponema sp.]|jgi:two-component system response regulator YesN|nr:response regulator [Treponema sp.]